MLGRYTKAITAAAIPLAAALLTLVNTGEVNAPEIGLGVVGLLNGVAVLFTPNVRRVAETVKARVAVFLPLAAAVGVYFQSGKVDAEELGLAVVAILSGAGVVTVSNKDGAGFYGVASDIDSEVARRRERRSRR